MKGTQPIYILGTGLSHDGSAVLLKDGKIIVGIEKERITRRKHDGGNDLQAIQYCLDAAGITINDLSLVVQSANFEKDIAKSSYLGRRLFPEDCRVPFITISHHLAHAWGAIGTSPFDEANILIIDGCGSPYEQCDDIAGSFIPQNIEPDKYYCEKDSYYNLSDNKMQPLYKDFAEMVTGSASGVQMPTIRHSIGGLYSMVSHYTFGNLDDAGKLMGLAPYGNPKYNIPLFNLQDGRCFVNEEAFSVFDTPSNGYEDFKTRFQYFADIAAWVQQEVETAILYTINSRLEYNYHPNLCYAGGVALNAKANARILRETRVKNLYIQPAAGDNGLSIGCACYGWHYMQQQIKVPAYVTGNYYGRSYNDDEVILAADEYTKEHPEHKIQYSMSADLYQDTARLLSEGKVIAWYQDGAEFGPRALGNRSIIADPRIDGVREHINRDIKFREDFRPFAPSVLAEDVRQYFKHGYNSPYMILVDEVNDEWRDKIPGVVHRDRSARTQTVTNEANSKYYDLLCAWRSVSGISVLLNTSFNKRGMPIVETPAEALSFFYECALDILVINNFIFYK